MINEFDYYAICNEYSDESEHMWEREQIASSQIENEWINFVELWDEHMEEFYNENLTEGKLHILFIDENCNEKEYTFNNYDDFVLFHTELFLKLNEIRYGFYTIYTHGIYLTLKNNEKTIEINIKSLEEK